MASKVGKKAIDFVSVTSKLPNGVRSEFNAFRNKYDAIRASLAATPEKPKPIDWEYYKQNVNNAALVASFQKAYQGIKVPYPVDTMSEGIKKQELAMDKDIKTAIAQSEDKIKNFQNELAALKAEQPFEDMTVHDYLKQHPSFEKKIQEEIRSHNWSG